MQTWLFSQPKFMISSDVLVSNLFFKKLVHTHHGRIEQKQQFVFSRLLLHDLCAQIGTVAELKQVTVRKLLRKTAAVRNSMVTYGGKTIV